MSNLAALTTICGDSYSILLKFPSRPLTPTTADLKALDEEVEQKLEKNALKLDDWSEEDPYAGMGAVERIFKKYIMLPRGRC